VRRRNGATLGLVAICMLVLIIIGAACYFIAKILGGGREVANATDAGALQVAKQALKQSIPAPAEFTELQYPMGSGITLMTYNRCVAKVMLTAVNASHIGGTANSNVSILIAKLNTLGTTLASALASNSTFNSTSSVNQHRMINQLQAVTGSVTVSGFMKTSGATNVFFNTKTIAGLTIPNSNSTKKPLNVAGVANPSAFYMAGYAPIVLPGGLGTIYGTPIFPQLTPHLVSLNDFNGSLSDYGTAPPNAFRSDSNLKEQKTNLFTGAVACAIVGAVNQGGTAGPIGNGFEFPAALPYGYIEIQNLPANPKPPGYDASAYDSNIFNNWLSKDTYMMGNQKENSTTLVFSHDSSAEQAWFNYANNGGPVPSPDPAPTSNQAVFIQVPGLSIPVQLTSANAAKYLSQLKNLKNNVCNCYQQLSEAYSNYSLIDTCVPGASAITALSGQQFPSNPPPNAQQNFSNVDQVKAQVLTAFANKAPKADAPNEPWSLTAAPIVNTGLGVYAGYFAGATPTPLPSPTPVMSVPSPYKMPLQTVGNVWQLLNQVGANKVCGTTTTLQDLTLRCQQIQPKTTDAQVISLLQSPGAQLPMASAGSTTPTKIYIYLPGGDLSQPLTIGPTTPPGFNSSAPDGLPPAAFPGPPCQYNKYYIQDTLVNSRAQSLAANGDELVHIAPYTDEQPPVGSAGEMYAYDWAHWWPGSGALNNMGRLWFENGAYGSVNFSHIN
jgi:hypothetical protein